MQKYRSLLSLLGLAGLIFFFNLLFFRQPTQVGFYISTLAIQLYIFWTHRDSVAKLITKSPALWLSMFVIAFGGYVFFFRAYDRVLSFIGFSQVVNLLFSSYILSTETKFFHSLGELVFTPFITFWRYLVSPLQALAETKPSSLMTLPFANKINFSTQSLLGIIIGVPLAGLVLFILMEGDAVFSHNVEELISFELTDRLISRISRSIWIFFAALPLLLLKIKRPWRSPFAPFRVHTSSAGIIVGLVALVVGSYLVIQSEYIFASVENEPELAEFGVATFSEYVTQGFFELSLVASIIYLVLWLSVLSYRGHKAPTRLKYAALSLFGISSIFIASIFRRVSLYQQYHGLSLTRVYGLLFLLWLSAMFVFLVMRFFKKRPWMYAETIVSVAVFVIFGYWNAEAYIATQNPPTVNERIDYVYLSRMSADGVAGWDKAMDFARHTLLVEDFTSDDGLIDHDERLQIAYAGTVVKNVGAIHNRNGRKFDKTVSSRIQEVNKASLEKMLVSLEESYLPPTDPAVETWEGRRIAKIRELLAAEYAATDSGTLNYRFNNYHVVHPNMECGFQTTAICLPLFVRLEDFSESQYYKNMLGKEEETDRDKKIREFLLFNKSQEIARRKYGNFVFTQEYEDLQNAFIDYTLQIIKQPEDEREIEVDISLNSAF